MPKIAKVKKKVTKTKAKNVSKPKTKVVSKTKEVKKGPIKISKTYIPKDTEKYMCEKHKVFFRIKLQEWKKELVKSNNEATTALWMIIVFQQILLIKQVHIPIKM